MMEKITKYLIKTLAVICIISSCEIFQRDEYYYLPGEKTTQLTTGDTLVFIDNFNKFDTLFLYKSFISTYRKSLSGSDCQITPSAYVEVNTLYFVWDYKDIISRYCEGISEDWNYGDCEQTYYCKDAILISIWADGNNYPVVNWHNKPFAFTSIIDEIDISGNIYNNVFKYASPDFTETDSINELYYSYKYGILKMSRGNGDILKIF